MSCPVPRLCLGNKIRLENRKEKQKHTPCEGCASVSELCLRKVGGVPSNTREAYSCIFWKAGGDSSVLMYHSECTMSCRPTSVSLGLLNQYQPVPVHCTLWVVLSQKLRTASNCATAPSATPKFHPLPCVPSATG